MMRGVDRPAPHLHGERVALRPERPEDADVIARGFAELELLVGWAQGDLGLHRIEIHTLPENIPMQRLAVAAGFTREGVLRDYSFERGRLVDNVVFARLPGD